MATKRSYRTLWMVALGALLGGALATWLAPKWIAWYWEPPVSMGVNCRLPIEWSLKRFMLSQVAGVVGGAIVFLVFSLMIGRNKQTEAI